MDRRIVINKEILAGKPIIKGTRISVEFVLELLSSGMSIEDIVKEYPHLKKEDILAALEYATQMLRHEEVYQTMALA
jgi:uncharacterized protein (DUF433 family)